jgi:hypothetical protein
MHMYITCCYPNLKTAGQISDENVNKGNGFTGFTHVSVTARTHVCTYCSMVWDFFCRIVPELSKFLLSF